MLLSDLVPFGEMIALGFGLAAAGDALLIQCGGNKRTPPKKKVVGRHSKSLSSSKSSKSKKSSKRAKVAGFNEIQQVEEVEELVEKQEEEGKLFVNSFSSLL